MVSLVVPGSSDRMLAKARELEVEELVIDLEDAVVPERKSEALDAVVQALGTFAAGRVVVRVNAIGSPWAHRELIALAAVDALSGVVVPKVENAGDLAFVDRLLTGAEAAAGRGAALGVQALIETAPGLAALPAITAATQRLDAIILGYADLSVSLGRSPAGRDDLDRWGAIQDQVLVAARAAGIRAIDGPYLQISDGEGLERSARRAAENGYDGKWAIHPAQLDPIRAAFTPTADEIERAEAVLDALAQAAEDGGGTVALDGAMLDEPVRLAALRTLARAAATR